MAPIRPLGLMGDLLSMRERMNKLLEETALGLTGRQRPASGWEPPVDIYEKEDAFMLEIELPGVPLRNVEVEVKDGSLHIKGSKSSEEPASGLFLRQERPSGEFHRIFSLPAGVEQEKVGARLKDGVLTVTVPKKETTRPQQITVDVQ